eukprot:4859632-Pleurochrysis_carterae.AAC.1
MGCSDTRNGSHKKVCTCGCDACAKARVNACAFASVQGEGEDALARIRVRVQGCMVDETRDRTDASVRRSRTRARRGCFGGAACL